MTREDIIGMAQECQLIGMRPHLDGIYESSLERFAALVATAEREACAQLAEETICDTHLPTGVRIYGSRAAAAIRERSKHGEEMKQPALAGPGEPKVRRHAIEWHKCRDRMPPVGEEVLVWIDGHRGPAWRNNHALVAYRDLEGWWEERHPSKLPLVGVIAWAYIGEPEDG